MSRRNNSEISFGSILVLLGIMVVLILIINWDIKQGDQMIVRGEVTDTSINLRSVSQDVVIDGKIITIVNSWDFYKMEKGKTYEVEVSKVGDTYYFIKVIQQID